MYEDQEMIEVDQEDQAMDTSESPGEQQWKGIIEALQEDMTKHVSTLITGHIDKLLTPIIVDMVMVKAIRALQTKLKDRLGFPTQSTEAPIIKRLTTMMGIQLMKGILCSERQSTLTAETVIPAMMEVLGRHFEQIMSQEINQVLNDILRLWVAKTNERS